MHRESDSNRQGQLKLSTREPLASGAAKWVYEHPEIPGAIIKIAKYTQPSKPSGRLSRLSRYWEYVCQIIEHLAIREMEPENAKYLEKVIGLVETDIGVGLVVEGIWTKNGELAPTLRQLKGNGGLSTEQRKAFEALLTWAGLTDVVIRDFSTSNSVWDERHQCFVIIDGVGAKPAFTLRNISRPYNRKTNEKKAAKLRKRILGKH